MCVKFDHGELTRKVLCYKGEGGRETGNRSLSVLWERQDVSPISRIPIFPLMNVDVNIWSLTHAYTHIHKQYPEAVWQCANPTLCACSFTHSLGLLTGLWHSNPVRPPWLPSSDIPFASFPQASNPNSQAQCGFTYCHNDTLQCSTSTLREWAINQPLAIYLLSVKSGTVLCYQSSTRYQDLLSFLPLF